MAEESKTTILGEDLNNNGNPEDTPSSTNPDGNGDDNSFVGSANTGGSESTDNNDTNSGGGERTAQSYLDELVGEGKKYKTIEDLAKGYVNADQYINTLKDETSTLKSELEKAKTVDEIMEMINKDTQGQFNQQNNSTAQGNGTPPDNQQGRENDNKTLTKEDFDRLWEARRQEEEQRIKQEQQNQQIKDTQKQSWDKLTNDLFGGDAQKAKQAVQSLVQSDPAMGEVVNTLGSYNPDKLVTFVRANMDDVGNPEGKVNFADAPSSTTTTNQNQSNTGRFNASELTWKQCQKVRKENPRLFNSLEFQQTMAKAYDTNPNFMQKK